MNVMKVYHHLARFLLLVPQYSCPLLLYLSHNDEVELMVTFTPADVISVVCPRNEEVGEDRKPAESVSCPPAEATTVPINQLSCLFYFVFPAGETSPGKSFFVS